MNLKNAIVQPKFSIKIDDKAQLGNLLHQKGDLWADIKVSDDIFAVSNAELGADINILYD